MQNRKHILNLALAASSLMALNPTMALGKVTGKTPHKVPESCQPSKVPTGPMTGCPQEAERCLQFLRLMLTEDGTDLTSANFPDKEDVSQACIEKFQRDLLGE